MRGTTNIKVKNRRNLPMPAYFIQHLEVKNLWGYRDISLPLNRDVNILIGPNASGKTTILNLLRFIFTVDLLNLAEIPFDRVILRLKSLRRAVREAGRKRAV
jgi:predicted ATP-binding protein involved in virulence